MESSIPVETHAPEASSSSKDCNKECHSSFTSLIGIVSVATEGLIAAELSVLQRE